MPKYLRAPARQVLAKVAVCLIVYAPQVVHAGTPTPEGAREEPESDEKTKLARNHFKNGVKLYRDANYAGALAEFEAAYQLKPGAGSLQNVALCHKALFRYAEAAGSLETLLARHSAELSEPERRAVQDAILELKALVGSIVITVTPASARVTVNGRSISEAERSAGIELNVGEHTVSAEAPGYARASKTLRIAGGQSKVPVVLELRPTAGFLNIVASDPKAAIAVDGVTRAFHRWHGPVEPDKPHLVQVFREGYEPFETHAEVALGKTVEIEGELGPSLDGDDDEPNLTPAAATDKPKAKSQDPRGWYGLLALSTMELGQHPLDLNVAESTSRKSIGAVGLRGGYRIWRPIAAELVLEAGSVEVREATSASDPSQRWNYDLTSQRIGANLRLMTVGPRVRFTSTLGTGAVHHRVELTPLDAEGNATTKSTTQGVDPYFSLELGIQFNFWHILAEADVLAIIDGVGALKRTNADDKKPFDSGTLPMIGLGLRAGWSQWKP